MRPAFLPGRVPTSAPAPIAVATAPTAREALPEAGRSAAACRHAAAPSTLAFPGSMVTTTADAHSGFITRTIALPGGRNVSDVCISITDNPNTVASQRASVLIDDVRLWNANTSAVGWRETFSRTN